METENKPKQPNIFSQFTKEVDWKAILYLYIASLLVCAIIGWFSSDGILMALFAGFCIISFFVVLALLGIFCDLMKKNGL